LKRFQTIVRVSSSNAHVTVQSAAQVSWFGDQ